MARKTDIIDLVETELKRIDGTEDTRIVPHAPRTFLSNVYNNVDRQFRFIDDVNDFPFITFISTNETRTHIGGGVKYGTLDLTIRGYVQGENALNLADDLAEDIEYILGTLAFISDGRYKDIEDVRIISISTDEGLFEPLGICLVDAQIEYLISL